MLLLYLHPFLIFILISRLYFLYLLFLCSHFLSSILPHTSINFRILFLFVHLLNQHSLFSFSVLLHYFLLLCMPFLSSSSSWSLFPSLITPPPHRPSLTLPSSSLLFFILLYFLLLYMQYPDMRSYLYTYLRMKYSDMRSCMRRVTVCWGIAGILGSYNNLQCLLVQNFSFNPAVWTYYPRNVLAYSYIA
jgi:hypothetical protein